MNCKESNSVLCNYFHGYSVLLQKVCMSGLVRYFYKQLQERLDTLA